MLHRRLTDQLLAGREPKEVFNKDGLFDELKKALAGRVLNAEIDDHLDGEAASGKANHRNGYSKKTVLTRRRSRSAIPRDREGTLWKDRKPIAAELKAIYRATDADLARKALEDFDAGAWGRKYPAVAQSWRRNWEHVIPFFAFPVAVRRIVYTTNAIKSLNAKLRRAERTRGHFPTDEAAIKLLFLVLRRVAQTWKTPPREWRKAKTQFAIMFDDRSVEAYGQPDPAHKF